MPVRIQRQRTKGWRMPEGAVYVGRPSRWGNPFDHRGTLGDGLPVGRADAVALFEEYAANPLVSDWLAPLRGRDLACWCGPAEPCHADVLLELANG